MTSLGITPRSSWVEESRSFEEPPRQIWTNRYPHIATCCISNRIPAYPGNIPQASPNLRWKEFLHKVLVEGLGVCWKIHWIFNGRYLFQTIWVSTQFSLPWLPSELASRSPTTRRMWPPSPWRFLALIRKKKRPKDKDKMAVRIPRTHRYVIKHI